MPAQLRAFWERILEWWNHFTTRQKTFIVVGATATVLTVGILIAVLTRPQYVTLFTGQTSTELQQVRQLLDESETPIDYKISADGKTFSVNKKQLAEANFLLTSNRIVSDDYSINNVTTGSFSTTESDKQRLYVDFLQKKLANDFLENFDVIEWANVDLHVPDNDGTLLRQELETSANLLLRIREGEEFGEENAEAVARAVATAVGNATTNNITIMDTKGNLLFAGGEESTGRLASKQLTYKANAEAALKQQVRNVLVGTSLYNKVEVGANLVVDYANEESVEHLYYANDGMTQGMIAHQDTYSSTNNSGVSGVPGTDSNDETTYVLQDNQESRSSVDEESTDYLPNEKVTTRTSGWGNIDYTLSTVSVTAVSYVVNNEADYRADEHDGLSWSEYKAANVVPIAQTDEATLNSMRQLVAGTTGIPPENVTVALYNENIFMDREAPVIGVTDILQIVLIIAILALLAFVILRSMRTAREEEEEQPVEELSVEQLLESQPLEADIDSIDIDDGSETRKLIEKFIDDNPEAAASLLRNWLNDGFT